MSTSSSFKCLEVPTTGQDSIKAYFFLFELPISGTVDFTITDYTAPAGETKGLLKVSYDANTGSSTSVMMMIRDQNISIDGTSTPVDFSNTELELYKQGGDKPKIKGKIQRQTTTKLFEDEDAAIADDELRYKVVNYQDSAEQSNYFLLFASRTSQEEHSNLFKVSKKASDPTVLECGYQPASGNYPEGSKVAAIGFKPSPNKKFKKAEIKGVSGSSQTIDYTNGVVNC
jgi:hypothetical protein